MIITKIQGGLGNQMFQYCLGLHLSLRNNVELKLFNDVSSNGTKRDFQLNLFNMPFEMCGEQEIRKLVGHPKVRLWNKRLNQLNLNFLNNHICEKELNFNPQVFDLKDNFYLEGYWQSPKYFEPIIKQINAGFKFKEDVLLQNKYLLQQIMETESVAIHIRRGDYLTNPFHKVLDVEYYHKGIDILRTKYCKKITLFVFSDDLPWCKNNLDVQQANLEIKFCDGGSGKEDFHLMTFCKHFIISNSTFAWWAAYLSTNKEKIVIAPKYWFNNKNISSTDLIPESWIKI